MSTDPKMVINRLLNHLADAVGDVASDMLSPASGFADDKWDRKIAAARKGKVRDLQGWLADELYNDPDTISDLIGDRLYDECRGDDAAQLVVLNTVINGSYYPALKKAAKSLKKLVEGRS